MYIIYLIVLGTIIGAPGVGVGVKLFDECIHGIVVCSFTERNTGFNLAL